MEKTILDLASELTPSERIVLKFIMDHEGEDGITLTNEEMSKHLNDMPAKQIQSVLNSLTFMEYITRENNVWVKGIKYRRVLRINNEY